MATATAAAAAAALIALSGHHKLWMALGVVAAQQVQVGIQVTRLLLLPSSLYSLLLLW
jgi:hypothetical protein